MDCDVNESIKTFVDYKITLLYTIGLFDLEDGDKDGSRSQE